MNDVDTDKHRHTTGNEEGPDHRHNDDERMLDAPPDMLPGDASGRVLTILSALDELGTDYWLEAGGGWAGCWGIGGARAAQRHRIEHSGVARVCVHVPGPCLRTPARTLAVPLRRSDDRCGLDAA